MSLFAVWVGATASAPYRQRNEARRLVAELQSRDGTISVEPTFDGGAAAGIRIENKGQSVDIQVQVEVLRGLSARRKDLLRLPYTVPRLGWNENIAAVPWEERREQRLMMGAATTLPLLTLFARQDNPPHTLLRLWGIEHLIGGWTWVNPENDDDQHIAFDLLILISDAPPLRKTVDFRLKDRKFSVIAPVTDEVADVVSQLSDESKRVFVDKAGVFRRGRVRETGALNSAMLEELRRFGVLESKRVDLGWWSRDHHKGMADFYYLTSLGAQVLDFLSQETNSE